MRDVLELRRRSIDQGLLITRGIEHQIQIWFKFEFKLLDQIQLHLFCATLLYSITLTFNTLAAYVQN